MHSTVRSCARVPELSVIIMAWQTMFQYPIQAAHPEDFDSVRGVDGDDPQVHSRKARRSITPAVCMGRMPHPGD